MIQYEAIGFFHSKQVHPFEAGRQPDAHHSSGYIELQAGKNFEQALIGLEGCERLWIIFSFHHNEHWNPMVLPPRGRDQKIGVFATRSPYRPNNIGMSCVKLTKIEKLKIYVEGADILDGSPILDIKPYVAYADSFDSEPDWLKDSESFTLEFSPKSLFVLDWLKQNGLDQLESFLKHQLEYEPTNSKKKRVKASEGRAGENTNSFTLAYRTWRAEFILDSDHHRVTITDIFSGYSAADLNINAENYQDKYQDKELHRVFKSIF